MLDTCHLHQYQRDIANFILHQPNALVIAEMGLGKTVSTLMPVRWLQQNKGCGPALILAPLRVVYNSWPDELANWAPLTGATHHIIHGEGKTPYPPRVDFYLSNYESLSYIIEKKLYKPCEVLILDESSLIKSHQTKRFKLLKKIQKHFKRVILLTGTPSPSGQLTELFTQTFMLDGGRSLSPSYWQFKNRYYEKQDFMGYDWQLRPGAKQDIEQKISPMVITLKAEDWLKLPPLIRSTVHVDLPEKAKAVYMEMEKEFLVLLDNNIITAANAAVMSSKLRQITAGGIYNEDGAYTILHQAKIEALNELTETTDSNVLCAFQFKFEKTLLQRTFPKAEFIDGSTSAAASSQTLKRWNHGKIKLLCCHPQSVGHGLNMQSGGNVLVWLSPDWSLERTQQMDARVYRQGQKNKVFIYTMACKETIDNTIIQVLARKGAGQNSLINALKQYSTQKRR